MTTNHDDHGDEAFVSWNDPLDSLLREWHAENATRAAAQRDKLMQAVAARNTLTPTLSIQGEGDKRQLREQLKSDSARHNTSSPTEGGRYALSLKGEGVRATRFARLTPAIAASLAFAATLGLLFSTAGPQSQARADVIMAPNGGRLDAVNARGELIGPCPLRHTDVHVDVSGSFARVTLQQRYGNPYADKIEAVYTFPLSHRAAVDRMTMTIGDRIVVGEVKEREAARATYEAAKSAGHAAALLEQERPNIFTQSVANIEPGVEIVVEISYVELLEARDGLFGFTFPMVVAPRYIPGGDDSSKPLPAGLQHREGLNLLAPGTLTITANGDTLNNGVLTADVINALISDAVPIEAPPAEYWASHYPTTRQPALWHQFEIGYMDGQREAAVLYTDGLGQINGRWFYIDAGSAPKSAAGTGFASGTAQVPDAARMTPQPVMPPTRAGHDISITVNIDTGGPGITDLKSESHAVQQNWGGMRTDGAPSQVAVGLNDVATIPNRDFVLHWRQTADTITEQVFTHAGAHGGFITLILNPPARVENTDAVPRELVFVLDTSGSMQGFPIQKAKEVMSKAIAALRPQDTFNLITFAGDTTILWDSPQPATPDKLAEAQRYVETREGRGGTEMMTAINAALTVNREVLREPEGAPTPVRIVCFLTDGEVGNDMAIIDAVKQNAATTRVFSFGIGNSVNRYLLDGIAKAGRGAAEYVLLSEGADEKVAAFTQRIQSPVLINVKLDFAGDIEIVDRVPEELPDLYDVSPIIVHARYTKGGKGSVTLRGDAGSGPYEKVIELDLPEAKAEHDVIATLWAREKVEQIMNRDLAAAQNGTFPDELKKQVIDLGETFQIMTQYTSFVAVENLRVTIGGQPRLVPVPIELPEGQSWEGTMGEAVNKWADEVAPQDVVGRTVDMWSLVRANNTTPKQFNVPSQTDTPDPAQDTTAYYDFLTEVHLAYSYQYQADPNRPALGTGSDPTFPLMAAEADKKFAEELEQALQEVNRFSETSALADAGTDKLMVVQLKHKTAYDIAFTIEDMLKPKSGAGPLFDEGPNEKTLIAKNVSPERREAVRKMIEMFDVPDDSSSENGVISLDAKDIPAEIAAKMLADFGKTPQPEHPSELAESESYARIMEGYESVRADGGRSIASNMEIHSPGATLSKKGTDIFRTWYYQDSNNTGVSKVPASEPGQPPPSQTRGRALILGRSVTTPAEPAQPGEVQAGLTLNRFGLADSLARGDSTAPTTLGQPVIAAAEGRQAGADTRLRAGYIATPAAEPASPQADVVLRELTSSANPAPRPSILPSSQSAPATEYSTVDLYAEGDRTGGVGGAIADMNGYGLSSVPFSAPTSNGGDVNGDGVSDLGDIPALRFASPSDVGEKGLDMKPKQSLDTLASELAAGDSASTSTPANSDQIVYSVMSGTAEDLAKTLEEHFRKDDEKSRREATPSAESVTLQTDLTEQRHIDAKMAEYLELIKERYALNGRLEKWAGDANHTNRTGQDVQYKDGHVDFDHSAANSLPDSRDSQPTFVDLQKLRTGSNEDSNKDYIVKGVEAVMLEAEFLPRSVTLGETAQYTVTVTNNTNQPYKNVAVNVALPDGLRLVQDSSYLPLKRMGNRIVFALQPMLGPKARLQWTVRLCGVSAGDHRITAFLDYEGWKREPTQESESALVRPGPGDQQALSPEAISEIERQWTDGTVNTDESAKLTRDVPAADVAQVRPSMRRPGDTTADRMLLDQLLVRTATLARAGRMEASMAMVEAILKARPAPSPLEAEGDQGGSPKSRVSIGDSPGRGEGVFAVARAMHDVLSSGVLTNDSIINRVCELAAEPAKRLTASAERARLMAKRLDERLLRLAVGDSTIRTHHASGGPAATALRDKPPAAQDEAIAGLDVTDASVLVSVLVDAFGDGTVATLTKVGLKIESSSKPTRVVIGRIAIKRLAELATCKHVRRVEAVKVR